MRPAVQFENVSLAYGDVSALDGIDLDVHDGEFFGILGPSGSGKTSALRLISGFERPTAGQLRLHGAVATETPPYDRDVNTVFQDYALFPHMNVEQNVAYGLMVRGASRAVQRDRAAEMLEMVHLEGFGSRRPGELSGGQRQRVALARALINRPRVLLLDEPLGALDLQLRQKMQVELRSLQRSLGITFIFVTHDQGEALSMSDHLAVFDAGRIAQSGTPREIYERPMNRFVAEFVGDSNIIEGGRGVFSAFSGWHSLRPERVRVRSEKPADSVGEFAVSGRVTDVQFHGASVRTVVSLDAQTALQAVTTHQDGSPGVSHTGDEVWLCWCIDEMHALPGPSDSP